MRGWTLSPSPWSESQLLHLPARLPAVLSRASYLNLSGFSSSFIQWIWCFLPTSQDCGEGELTHLDHCLARERSTQSTFVEMMMVALGLFSYPFPGLQYWTSLWYTLHSVISIYSSISLSQGSEIFGSSLLVFLMKKLRPRDIRYKPGWGQASSLSQELPAPSHSPNMGRGDSPEKGSSDQRAA